MDLEKARGFFKKWAMGLLKNIVLKGSNKFVFKTKILKKETITQFLKNNLICF
ncbi:hypothetical protein ACFFWB_26665 [Flavobacterium procerum]|uniref:hypothetical protein n=1 Tax=Flavobacterium procerum TaxID=1455569 RepID=UPI0035E95721